MLALGFIAVKELKATPAEMGILAAAGTSSFLLVGLIAGAWVDRWSKRRVMLIADLVRMLAMAAVPILYFMGQLDIWHVIVIEFVLGLATVFFDVAYQSFVPVLLPPEKIAGANSALETSNQVAGITGPGLVGGLLEIIRAPLLLIIDAFSYLVSAFSLLMIKDSEKVKEKADRRPLAVEIREGLAFVVRQPLIKRITATTATSNLFSSILFSIFSLVFLGEQYLNYGPAQFGLLGSVAAIGSLLGAISTTRLIKLIGEGTVISVSAFLSGFVFLLFPLAVGFANETTLPILFLANFLNGFLILTYNITQVSARQRLCPPELLGRMNASIRFFVWGVMPIGGLVGGGIATAFGTQAALWTGAIGGVFASSFVVFSPLTKMKTLPDSPVEK